MKLRIAIDFGSCSLYCRLTECEQPHNRLSAYLRATIFIGDEQYFNSRGNQTGNVLATACLALAGIRAIRVLSSCVDMAFITSIAWDDATNKSGHINFNGRTRPGLHLLPSKSFQVSCPREARNCLGLGQQVSRLSRGFQPIP